MADGQATYDYTQDQDFLKAPPEQQHAYLSSIDPDYAKAPPEQQQAYRGHLSQHIPTEAEAGAAPPTAPMPQKPNELRRSNEIYDPALRDVRTEQAKAGSPPKPGEFPANSSGMELPEAMMTAGAMGPTSIAKAGWPAVGRAVNTVARGTVGAAGGAAAGRYGGRAIGGMVGHPEAGETIGSLVGGLAGGYAGVKSIPEPFDPNLPVQAHAEMEQDIAKGVQERAGAKAEMERDIAKSQQQRAGAKGEMEKDIAARAAKQPEAIAERGLAVGKAKSNLVHGRPFEQLNEQEQAEALMRRGNQQRQIDEGLPVEGSSQKPLVVPEPREAGPADRPGSQWSVKRRSELPNNAKRAQPGASDVLQNLRPVVIEPRGEVGTNPRPGSTIAFDEGGKPIVPMGGGSKGLTNPESVLGEQFPAPERRTAPRVSAASSAPPDPIREARLGELRKAVRDPSLSDRDRSIVQSQLADMESNPGERNTLGDNPSQLKKPQPTMSREEAEAAGKKREEGRNARFNK